MNDIDLARRAVACKGWRAINGMAFVDHENRWGWRLAGDVVVWDHHCGWPGGPPRDQEAESIARALPDFRDPATRGCLLEMVREAWDDPGVTVRGMLQADGTYQWYVMGDRAHGDAFYNQGIHATEEAALVAALEAAKEKGQ